MKQKQKACNGYSNASSCGNEDNVYIRKIQENCSRDCNNIQNIVILHMNQGGIYHPYGQVSLLCQCVLRGVFFTGHLQGQFSFDPGATGFPHLECLGNLG